MNMSDSETNNDKRRDKRFIILELEVYRQDTGERLGKMINLSRGGMLVMRQAPMEVNFSLGLKIPLNKEVDGQIEFDVEAKVAWYRQNEISDLYSIGFEFVNLTPEQSELLENMIVVFGSEEI
jgi:c-di-GMP-binding flagellar brake protein YcgR